MTARRMVLRSVAWRGEDGEPAEFVAVPPKGYERYQVGGVLRAVSPETQLAELDTVTITDKETGATVTMRGAEGILVAPAGDAPEYITRLWADARYLAGLARRLGRPPGLTNIANDEQVRSVIRQLRRDQQKRHVTQQDVITRAATFSKPNLRSYLRVTGRTWQEFLDTS